MKKILGIGFAAVMLLSVLAGCGAKAPVTSPTPSTSASAAPSASAAETKLPEGAITVVSREEGSGTRGAFIEIMGIQQKDSSGETVDMTTDNAEIANGQNVVMTSVAANKKAIGYISLGSLNETVKAVTVDGVEVTAENIINGSYKVARPFNIASMKGEYTPVAQDFVNFILSEDGQKIALEHKYISEGNTGAYKSSGLSGKIVCAGSTSVSPLMEKLAEAYMVINPNVEIEIQSSGSTAGMTSAIEGICDIGMSSRELKDSEIEAGLVPTVIAMDGIAVIVNNENGLKNLTGEQITAIYTGEITEWSELG